MTPLVTTGWLHDHLHDDNLRIIDIRGHVLPASEPPPHYFAHRAEYGASHIPGAVFVDWVTDITDPDSPNGTQVATPAAYAALMRRLGVGDETLVVAYDDANGMFAARLWWTLRYYGHPQVKVLDGGWQKWLAEKRPTTADVPEITPATFTPRPEPALRRTLQQVQAALDSETVLVDVRSPMEYNGAASRAKRAGHIPGAINIPRKSLLKADGTLDVAKVPALEGEIVLYCNAGVSASYGLLALHAAGVPLERLAVYDGSWKEWGNADSTPVVG